MLPSVLHSKRALQVNVEIMRTFVRLRKLVASNAEPAERLDQLEQKNDGQFRTLLEALRQLMAPAETKKGRIGFKVEGE